MVFFAFPSSPRNELQFLDGFRVVPEYLAALMAGIETEAYTYDETIKMVNDQMFARHVGGSFNTMIDEHMREVGRDGNR